VSWDFPDLKNRWAIISKKREGEDGTIGGEAKARKRKEIQEIKGKNLHSGASRIPWGGDQGMQRG